MRGGGVEVFAADLSIGVGDRVRVEGEISRPQIGEDGFDYGRYLATKKISALVEATSVRPMGRSEVGSARFTAVPTWPSDTASDHAKQQSFEAWY